MVYLLSMLVCQSYFWDLFFFFLLGKHVFAFAFVLCTVAGELSLRTASGNEQIVKVGAQTIHPNFNSETLANDICILSLKNNFTYNSNVAAILMDTVTLNIAESYSSGIVTGWGHQFKRFVRVCIC